MPKTVPQPPPTRFRQHIERLPIDQVEQLQTALDLVSYHLQVAGERPLSARVSDLEHNAFMVINIRTEERDLAAIRSIDRYLRRHRRGGLR